MLLFHVPPHMLFPRHVVLCDYLSFRHPLCEQVGLDSFLHVRFAILPCAVLAVVLNEGHFWKQSWVHYVFEILWAFSIYLEAIAIVPQVRYMCIFLQAGWGLGKTLLCGFIKSWYFQHPKYR